MRRCQTTGPPPHRLPSRFPSRKRGRTIPLPRYFALHFPHQQPTRLSRILKLGLLYRKNTALVGYRTDEAAGNDAGGRQLCRGRGVTAVAAFRMRDETAGGG